MPITISINVDKIDKAKLFKGKQGRYLNIVLIEHPSEYGDGFVKQESTKEEREQRVQLPIIGNWKNAGTMKQKRE